MNGATQWTQSDMGSTLQEAIQQNEQDSSINSKQIKSTLLTIATSSMKDKFLILVTAVLFLAIGAFAGMRTADNPLSGGTYRENTMETTLLDSASTTATGEGMSVVYYRNIGITVASLNATGTLKFQASLADAEPVWTSAKSATNTWDYVQVIDTEDASAIDGDTGIVLANTTDVRQFEANSNNFRWFNVDFPGGVSGTTTVRVKPSDNQ